jgi:hypothetical protein
MELVSYYIGLYKVISSFLVLSTRSSWLRVFSGKATENPDCSTPLTPSPVIGPNPKRAVSLY